MLSLPNSRFRATTAKRRRSPTSRCAGPFPWVGSSLREGPESGGGFLSAARATRRQRSVQTERGATTPGGGVTTEVTRPSPNSCYVASSFESLTGRRARIPVPRNELTKERELIGPSPEWSARPVGTVMVPGASCELTRTCLHPRLDTRFHVSLRSVPLEA